jgi:transformation/transcription domain-associated protein
MLFQSYAAMQRQASRFGAATVSALSLPLPPNARAMRSMYSDFIATQVKTVSFIAYLVRLAIELMRPSGDHIARGILNLLQNCPAEAAATRKELLVAARHIGSTDLRKTFLNHIDMLLDDQVLLSSGRTAFETLRPLAYTTLADLVHHLRHDLSISQMARAAHMFARNLHDTTLPMSIANMSARLLIGVAETVSRRAAEVVKFHQAQQQYNQAITQGQNPPPVPASPQQIFPPVMGRDLVFRILDAFVCKLGALRKRIPKLLEAEASSPDKGAEGKETSNPESADSTGSAGDSIKECRLLIKTLINALKPITVSLLTANPPKRLTADETRLFVKLLRDGMRCIALFTSPDDASASADEAAAAPAQPQPLPQQPGQQQQPGAVAGPPGLPAEKKELLDSFSAVFTILDSQAFAELFVTQMSFVYDRMLENNAFTHMASVFTSSQSICRVFVEILMNYLMEHKINNLADKKEGTLLLGLFKIAFRATATQQAMTSEDAETVLQPHLQPIVSHIIKMAGEIRDSSNYFMLLRNLFRHVQGRGDIITKELLPLMSGLLEGLNRLHQSAHSQAMRDLFVELALTMPMRLSTQLPFMRMVIKPLLAALDSADSVDQKVPWGLRMLENIIEKLSPDFLEPHLLEVKPRLMKALWRHLRPPPYPFAPQVLRIFGKLAGRSRNFFNSPMNLQTAVHAESGLTVRWRFDVPDGDNGIQSRFVDISLQEAIPVARRLMILPPSQQSFSGPARQVNSFKFIRSCISMYLDPAIVPGDSMTMSSTGVGVDSIDADAGSAPDAFPAKVEFAAHNRTVIKTLEKLQAERATLRTLLGDSMIGSTIENVAAEAKPYVAQLATHFSALYVTRRRWNPATLQEIDPLVFVDAIVDVISSENREHATGAVLAVRELVIACKSLLASSVDASTSPVFTILTDRFSAQCYKRDWHAKAGGCLGLATLAELLDVQWLRSNQLAMLRALFFVLKDLQPTVAVSVLEDTSAAITSIIKLANTGASLEAVAPVAAVFAAHLANPHLLVRKNAQSGFQTLAEAIAVDPAEVVAGQRELLEEILFGSRLEVANANTQAALNHFKQLSAKAQTGVFEALTYTFGLSKPLFDYSDALAAIIETNLPLAEQEEMSARANSVVSQRVALVELIASTMDSSFATAPQYEALRVRIVGIFLKLLTGRHKQIIASARRGIEVLQLKFNLTKEMLHGTLRPILLHLADFRSLSEALMEGICRLLALLPKSFAVTLGEKLLEHLSMWHQQPQKVVSSKQWKPGEEIRIAAGIVETMHLLPPQAAKFMDRVVLHVMAVEEKLPAFAHATKKPCPREITSPFRDALAKYLSKYPSNRVERDANGRDIVFSGTLDYFFPQLGNADFGRLLRNTLRNEHAGGLRDEIIRRVDDFVKTCFPPALTAPLTEMVQIPDNAFSLAFEGLQIIRILQKFRPNLLVECPVLLKTTQDLWKSPRRLDRLRSDESITVQMSKESLFLAKILLTHAMNNHSHCDVLFDLINAFVDKSTVDFSFLETFFTTYIPQSYSSDEKRNLIDRTMELFHREGAPVVATSPQEQEHKVHWLKLVLQPVLTYCIEHKDPAASPQVISEVLKKVVVAVGDQTFSPSLNIELLRLATLLVKNCAQDVMEHKKELIRFAWNHLKSEDLTTKQSAYLLVCRFVEAYETPAKIILQVYVSLLRAYQPDARHLVREALDTLTPALGKRLGANEPVPTWVKWTRKIAIEEGHTLQQMVHILQLIVRQSALFYPYRGQFVPYMVSALMKLCVQTNPYDSRKLAVSMVETIINWEKRRLEGGNAASSSTPPPPPSNDTSTPMEGVISTAPQASPSPTPETPAPSTPTPSTPGGPPANGAAAVVPPAAPATPMPVIPEFRLNPASCDLIGAFLIRVGSGILDNQRNPAEGPLLSLQAIKLLHEAFAVWPSVQIKVGHFEKLLEKAAESPALAITGLNMLDSVLEHQLDVFVVPGNAPSLENALIPVMATDNVKITEAFAPILARLLKKEPWTVTPDAPVDPSADPTKPPRLLTGLWNRLREIIMSGLPDVKADNRWCGENCVLMLKTICDSCPDAVVPYLPALLKFLGKQITKESQQAAAPQPGQPQPGQDPNQAGAAAANANQAAKDAAQKKSSASGQSSIFIAVSMLNAQMALLGNEKRVMFSAVQQVIDKSHDEALLVDLMKIAKTWVISKELMTPKDRNTFLMKLRRFEKVPNIRQLPQLHKDYVDVVVTLYTNAIAEPALLEELSALPAMFLGGLFSRDPSCRIRFFELLHQKLSPALVERMQQITNVSTWAAHPYLFWIQPASELLMCLAVQDSALRLSDAGARVPAAIFGQKAPVSLTANACGLLNQHFVKFITPLQALRARDLIDPLRDLMFHDADLCIHMFVSLFSMIWDGVLEKQTRESVLGNLLALLSHESMTKQAKLQPNVVQVLLLALSRCKTLQKQAIPVQLLKFCGSTFNAWHTSMKLLEDELVDPATPAEMMHPVFSSLSDMFRRLNEDDMYYGSLVALQSHSEESKAALVLEQHGMWHRAQEVFFNAMQNAQLGLSPLTSGQVASQKDVELWETHWIECAKRLTQWDLLADYARINSLPELLAEASWKLGDWAQLKDAFTKHGLSTDSPRIKLLQSCLALHESKIADVDAMCKQAMNVLVAQWIALPKTPSPAFTPMLHAFHQIIELYESAKIVKELGAPPQQRLHRLTDLKSSTLRAWRERLPSQSDDLLQWNDILVWRQHVFSMITTAFQQFEQSGAAPDSLQNTSAVLGYHEAAWAINKFSKVARKQGLVELCLNSLAKIYSLPNIDLADAFAKLDEQVKCFFDIPSQYRTAVDVINSTNLNYFPPLLIAQFFQLKGEFLTRLQSYEEANQAFSSAVLRYENLSKGWVGWGRFHESRLQNQLSALSSGGTSPDDRKATMPSALYAVACYLQAVKCQSEAKSRKFLPRVMWLLNYDQHMDPDVVQELLAATTPANEGDSTEPKTEGESRPDADAMEGVTDGAAVKEDDEVTRGRKRDATEAALENPAAKRVKTEGEPEPKEEPNTPATPGAAAAAAPVANAPATSATNPAAAAAAREAEHNALKQQIRNYPLANILADHSRYIPSWVWTFWVPQIIAGLSRPEAPVMKALLMRMIPMHSNAIFYALHSYIQRGLAELPKSADSMDVDGAVPDNVPRNIQLAIDVLEQLQQKYPLAVSDMTKLASELSALCESRVEDVFLRTLETTFALVMDQPLTSDSLSASLHQRVVSAMDFLSSKLDDSGAKSGFTRVHGSDFKRAFANLPTSSSQLTQLLSQWVTRTRSHIDGNVATRSRDSERLSPFLTEFQNDHYIEVPGQHQDDREAAAEQTAIIEKIESLKFVRSTGPGIAKRMLSIRGSNGKSYTFLLERDDESHLPSKQTHMIWARDARLSQLSRLLNRILGSSVQTKKRNIQFTLQEHVPLHGSARLVSIVPDVVTLSHIADQWALKNGFNLDHLVRARKTAVDSRGGAAAVLRSLQKTVPDDILLSYLNTKVLDQLDAIWALRKHLTTELSAVSVLQYLLGSASNVSPSSFFFSPSTGAVVVPRNHHEFAANGHLSQSNANTVPFRLTRNLQRMAGPIVHFGVFDASVTATISALSRDKHLQHLQDHLKLYLRDDLVEWRQATDSSPAESDEQLAERNAQAILERLQSVAPPTDNNSLPLNTRTTQLINAAVDQTTLSAMPLSWNAWI